MTLLAVPEATISVGGTSIATENLIGVHIHLGCTKEVSNFEVIVNNSNPDYHEADYSPGGSKEFTKGNEVLIKCTRGTIGGTTEYILTGTLESLEFVDQAEDYQYKDIVVLRGRCKGWQLFARKFDGDLRAAVGSGYKTYKRTSGEAESMIAYLIDSYTEDPLSHTRVNSIATANAAKDQKVVAVADGSKFAAGDLVKIKDTANWEYNKVASVDVNNVTMVNNLLENYTTAQALYLYLDLIRDSNTTYTKMEFTHETVFDIIKFISDTASTSGGVIGYDSRVEYDGEYAWLPRGHVTESNFDLTADVQLERYVDDATRIKNKITVFGKADKPFPIVTDGVIISDAWTDYADPGANNWATDVGGTIAAEGTIKLKGSYSVKHTLAGDRVSNEFTFDIYTEEGEYVDCNEYTTFHVWIRCDQSLSGPVESIWVRFIDDDDATVSYKRYEVLDADEWVELIILVGDSAAWPIGSIDWGNIAKVKFEVYHASATSIVYVDYMYFSGGRWGGHSTNVVSANVDGFAEDATSQSTYGTKEYVVINDMLLSDAECEAKALSLLSFYKDPKTTYELETETLDWGDHPIYVGDKISVDLTPLGITGDKRIDSVDIHLTSIDHRLVAIFILDNTPLRQADYLYNLSKKVRQLEKGYSTIR